MNIEFYCPQKNCQITREECCNTEESPCYKTCTSEMTATRKALYDWARAAYADRYAVTMKPDGTEIIVHDQMRLLADPCDETGDAYLEIYCGEVGETHCHPFDVEDMQRRIAALLDVSMVVALLTDDFCSQIADRRLYEQEPDRLHEWDHFVDAQGVYTPEEYAQKLGVTLPEKEFYFDCPKLGRRISETDCFVLSHGEDAPCMTCDCAPLQQAVVQHISTELLCARTTPAKIICSMGKVCIDVHPKLRIEFEPDGLAGNGNLYVSAPDIGSMHWHPEGKEALEMLSGFLRGEKLLLLGKMIIGSWSAFVSREQLRDEWRKRTRGRVRIADLKGVWEKKTFRERLLNPPDNKA